MAAINILVSGQEAVPLQLHSTRRYVSPEISSVTLKELGETHVKKNNCLTKRITLYLF